MSNLNNNRKNQPKFRPSLTIGDMLDCINALNKFNPEAPAITILRQFTVKLAVTNPELFPKGVGTYLNNIGHGHMGAGSLTSPNPNSPIASAEGVIGTSTVNTNHVSLNPVEVDPLNSLLSQAMAAQDSTFSNSQAGYPDSELPENVRVLKEVTYIMVMQSGAVSANASDYEIQVAIDTHIVKNIEANSAKLCIPVEALAMMCPLANKPSFEI